MTTATTSLSDCTQIWLNGFPTLNTNTVGCILELNQCNYVWSCSRSDSEVLVVITSRCIYTWSATARMISCPSCLPVALS